MKKMKRSITLYLATAALCLMLMFIFKIDSSAYSSGVTGISSNGRSVTITLSPYNYGYQYEVALLNRKGKQIASLTCDMYANFNNTCRKNRVYYYKSRIVDGYGNPVTGWSKKKAFTTIKGTKYKLKIKSKKNRTVSIRVPKVKGVKNYRIYVSPYYSYGYKKVKTAKPGKRVTISRYGGKKFSWNWIYYIRVVPKVKKVTTEGLIGTGSFRFTKVYKIRYRYRYVRRIIYY